MSALRESAVELAALLAMTVGLPWLGMRMLVPSLESSPAALRTNYRGRSVFLGLGIVWIFWAAGVFVLAAAIPSVDSGLPLRELGASIGIVLVVLLFGLVDDAYGSGQSRGFRGHLAELFHGRLTTGALKLLGIGLLSLWTAYTLTWQWTFALDSTDPNAVAAASARVFVPRIAWTLTGGAIIALSANLVNLLDLRPGRALKGYSMYVLAFCVPALVSSRWAEARLLVIALFIALIGPVVAVWRFDLGERGMLGDAGANAAGALIGYVVVWGLVSSGTGTGTLVAGVVIMLVLLAFNLASERFSFSAVIEKNSVLSWIDGLGRLPADTPTSDGIGDIKS